MTAYNNTLQVTFDPLPTFAAAKAGIASNAPERGRWVSNEQEKRVMGRGLQTKENILAAINLSVSKDWPYADHHCQVTDLVKSNGASCNWQVLQTHCGGTSLAHQEECSRLIDMAVTELASKYDIAWPEN